MPLVAPFNLVTATGAGSTLAKTLWPGTYTVTLPSLGLAADILNSTTPIGGVFKPATSWASTLIDFACVGAADSTVVVEIGGLAVNGAVPEVIATVTLKTVTTGTVANVNPFTGAVVAATTFRFVDLVSIASRSNVSQLLTFVGGTENDQPSTLILDTRQFSWYYVLVTSLGGLTSVTPVLTPSVGPSPQIVAGGGPSVLPVSVIITPSTTGGLSAYRNLDLGTTGQVVKASAGQLYGYFVSNNAASARFLKWYDKATAPTQADTPVFTYQIPANSAGNRSQPEGVAFSAGISVRATTGVADSDTGAPSTNDVIVNVEYK